MRPAHNLYALATCEMPCTFVVLKEEGCFAKIQFAVDRATSLVYLGKPTTVVFNIRTGQPMWAPVELNWIMSLSVPTSCFNETEFREWNPRVADTNTLDGSLRYWKPFEPETPKPPHVS